MKPFEINFFPFSPPIIVYSHGTLYLIGKGVSISPGLCFDLGGETHSKMHISYV